ncbi:MAG: outer membrane protein assembly factor BamC [Thiolinea sp.]
MMPEAKYMRLSVTLSSVLILSGCSALNFLNTDAVDDHVDYQKTAKSVRALAIPPGLSQPGFDGTYASVPVSASGTVSLANQNQVQTSNAAQVQAKSRQQPARAASVADVGSAPAVASDPNSSLGAALLAQSEAAEQVQTQTAQTQESKPAPEKRATKPRQSSLPQVAMMRLKGGEPAMAINANSNASWKLLGPILPRVGLKVTKQQPEQGILTTVYQGNSAANLTNGQTYLVLLAENASRQSFVGVADANGKPASEAVAQDILGLLKAEFEK